MVGTWRDTANEIYQPARLETNKTIVEKDAVREEKVKLKQGEAVAVLLLGIDSGGGRLTSEANTDVIILVTINPKTKDAYMISIPRDTYSEYTDSKINGAYAMGGAAGAMNAVQMLLDVPVDYYAVVNMSGFMNIIDAIGGVTIKNELSFSQGGYDFPIGTINLSSGGQALSYIRNRYNDPSGDYGRNDRQRKVLLGILDKFSGVSAITSTQPLLEAAANNVVTDLTWDDMVQLRLKYRISSKNVYSKTLIGTEDMTTGVYLNILSEGQRADTSSELRKHLGLESNQ